MKFNADCITESLGVSVRAMTEADVEEVRRIYTIGWQNAFRDIVLVDYLDNMDLSGWTPPFEGAYVLTDGKRLLGTSSIGAARDEVGKAACTEVRYVREDQIPS